MRPSRPSVTAAPANPPSLVPVTSPRRHAHTASALALAVQFAVVGGASVGAAWAPTAQAQQLGASSQAQAGETRRYDIPAGPLSDTLTRFATEAGIFLAGDTNLAEGKRSPGVQGRYSVRQALDALLAGTGVSAQFSGSDRVTLTKMPEDAPVVALRTLLVMGSESREFQPQETKFGVLGERTIMETPFSVSAFSEQLVDDTHARTMTDVLVRDPSVGSEVNGHGYRDAFTIRGFGIDNGSFLYDGVPGLYNWDGYRSVSNIERVEVLRGMNAFNNGAGVFGGVGGTINMVPKRPADAPINEVMLGFEESSSFLYGVDFSRRFGADRQFGVRFSGFGQQEKGNISRHDRTDENHALFLDWRPSDRLTLEYEFNRFRDSALGYRDNLSLAPGVSTPRVPDTSTNYSQPWASIEQSGIRHYVNAIYEFADNWTVTAGGGRYTGDSKNGYYTAFGLLQDDAGNLSVSPGRSFQNPTSRTGAQIKVDGEFETSSVRHLVTAGLTYMDWDFDGEFASGAGGIVQNIYNPTYVPEPPIGTLEPDWLEQEIKTYYGMYEARLFDERLSLFGGLRKVDIFTNANWAASPYDDSATSPFGSVSFRPTPESMIYASYSEGLEPGQSAPDTVINANEQLEPSVNTQYELGGKYDLGSAIASVAVFEMERPAFGISAANVFEEVGDQTHRGIEARLEGELAEGFRLIGGVTYLDAIINSPDAAVDGNRPSGVPEVAASLYADVDILWVNGLAMNVGIRYEGDQYIDNQNLANRKVGSWTEVDLGARYTFDADGTEMTARVFVDNLFDKGYWSVNEFGALSLSSPRTIGMSITANF